MQLTTIRLPSEGRYGSEAPLFFPPTGSASAGVARQSHATGSAWAGEATEILLNGVPLKSKFLAIIGGVLRSGFCLFVFCCTACPALGAPYPENGLATDWVQPDGTHLKLRVFGDEYYARTTTDDGYTVKFDEAASRYDYAILSADKKSLVCSGVAAQRPPPARLTRHLEEPQESIEVITTNRRKTGRPSRPARKKNGPRGWRQPASEGPQRAGRHPREHPHRAGR